MRTGPLPGGQETLEIKEGMQLVLTFDDVSTDDTASWSPSSSSSSSSSLSSPPRLHVDYENLAAVVQVGGNILLDDGLVALEVLSTDVDAKKVGRTTLRELVVALVVLHRLR